MKNYLGALKHCYENGDFVKSRAGNVKKSFGYQMRFDLQEGFPAVTTKKLAWKAMVSELLWFLEGSNDERRLAEILYEDKRDNLEGKNTIWTQNANSEYWKLFGRDHLLHPRGGGRTLARSDGGILNPLRAQPSGEMHENQY